MRFLMLVAFGLLLGGCGESIEEFGGPTMGSHYSLKYLPGPKAESLRPEVEAILAEVDGVFSKWRGDSWLSRFNRLPAGSCLAAPPAVLQLTRFATRLAEEGEGAFDVTLEPLLTLWGFGPQSRGGRVPRAEEIAALRSRIGQRHLRIDAQQLCKDAEVGLDFDSIVAGYTIDRIAERLASLGVDSFLLNVTGELKVQGHKPDGSPWQVAIEAPGEGQEAWLVLALDGYGVSTSGDYRNYFEIDGKRYSHTLDPRSGRPLEHELASVTVVDRSTLRAEGLSTLLMVLGTEQGLAFAERHGVAALFISRSAEGFREQASTALQALREQPM